MLIELLPKTKLSWEGEEEKENLLLSVAKPARVVLAFLPQCQGWVRVHWY